MSTFDPKMIRDALRDRGVVLNPPATVDALDRLKRWAGDALQPDVIALFREFDGFLDGDFEAESFVSVWPIDKALAHYWTRRPMLAFSDGSLNAVIFGFDPVNGTSVISLEDGRQVAPTYRDFWPLLLADRLF